MRLWTSGTSLNPREGLVTPDHNKRLKKIITFDSIIGSNSNFYRSFLMLFFLVAMWTVKSLDIKNLGETS
jgi:hypothetical protein